MVTGIDIENAYALIIGISEYKDPRIRRLNYTHADAEDIYKLLTNPKNLGLSKDNIRILLDRDATRFNINDAISNWLYKNADEDSVVFIFFAGHGGIEKDLCGIEKDKLAKYLLPFDSVVDNLFASAISNRDFNDLLLTIRSKKLVIFMDSCYSGGVSERGARDVKIMDDPYQKLAEGEGRLVIAASQPDQLSYENSEIEHGVFTDNLLKALSGAADWDNDGYVKVLDAWKYLQETVPKDAMKLAGEIQEPILRGDIKKDFVISIDRERFEKIKEEEFKQRKISKLLELRNKDKLSGKQYVRLREVVKIDFEKLSDKDKIIATLINDFLSEDFPITTFIEDLGIIEPELLPEKERQEQDRLRRQNEEEDRIQREKEREKALKEEEARRAREKQLEKERRDIELKEKSVKLKALEEAKRLELEKEEAEKQRAKQEDESQKKQREKRLGLVQDHFFRHNGEEIIASEKEELKVGKDESPSKRVLYVLLGGHCCILLLILSDLFMIFYNWEHTAEVLIFLLILTLVSIISTIIIYKIFKYKEISEILSYINIVLLLFLVLSLVLIAKVIFNPPGWGPFIFFLILSSPSVANLIIKKIIRGIPIYTPPQI